MGNFQRASYSLEGVEKILLELNNSLDDSLESSMLKKLIEKNWSDLDDKIKQIKENAGKRKENNHQTVEQKVDFVIKELQSQNKNIKNLTNSKIVKTEKFAVSFKGLEEILLPMFKETYEDLGNSFDSSKLTNSKYREFLLESLNEVCKKEYKKTLKTNVEESALNLFVMYCYLIQKDSLTTNITTDEESSELL